MIIKSNQKKVIITTKYQVVLLVIVICLLASTVASAQQKNQNDNSIYNHEDKTQPTGYESFNDGLRMFVSLLVVLALIVGSVFLLKKLPIYRNLTRGAKQPVSLVHNLSLGHRRSVCVLKVADEILLLGLTSTNISLLSKMNADEFYSSESLQNLDDQKPLENNQSFLDQLKKMINKR